MTRASEAFLFLTLLLVACGDNLHDRMQPQSGSRLKLAWYEYEGGGRELETRWYFDSELDERCTATAWSDAQSYCTPPIDEAVYVDDTCTRAVGRTTLDQEPATFFATTFRLSSITPSAPSRLFRRGEPIPAPLQFWQKLSDGCFPLAPSGSFQYFELASEAKALVKLQHGEPEGGSQLAVVSETGNDGLKVPIAIYDREANSECVTAIVPNTLEIACVPIITESANEYFLDSGCSNPVVAERPARKPLLVSVFDASTSCSSYYRLGDALFLPPSQLLFQSHGPTCALVARPDEMQFYELGERVRVPVIGRQREGVGQRIQSIVQVSDDLRLRAPLMYDTTLDVECRHGNGWCLPETVGFGGPTMVSTYYTDSQCQVALGVALVPKGACDPPLRFASDGVDYYELREPYTQPLFSRTEGVCSNYTPPMPYVAYRVGAPTDRSVFARGTMVIAP